MSIMTRLKSETADLHQAAESSPLQRRLVKGELPRDLYAAFLGQMYLVHAALEQAVRDASASHPGFSAVVREYHHREPQLCEDLAFLGVDLNAITPIGATTAMLTAIARTAAERPIALLGMLYVLEGSTNGSKFIASAVRKAYQLEQGPGAAYLDPHGELQRDRWQAFKHDMDSVGFTETEAQDIIATAKGMFRSITDISDELSLSAPHGPPGRHSLSHDTPNSSAGSERTSKDKRATRSIRSAASH